MDLISYDVRNGPPEGLQEVPLHGILEQHRRRYVVRSSLGDITLRFVGPIEKHCITLRIMAADASYLGHIERIAQLSQMIKDGITLTQQDLEEMDELSAAVEPHLYEFMSLAFEAPCLSGAEDLKALASALRPDEWGELRPMLIALTADEPAGYVDTTVIRLAQRFGIPIADGLTAETMTCQQAAVFAQALRDEQHDIRRAQEEA